VCSGIEAATNAWHDLGWEPVAFSEIDPFASAVLAARFPNVPNLGDLEKYREWNIEPGSVDVVVGGTPCQSFSVAGLRKGLDDPRGNLALVYLGLVDRIRPRYVVWENVPGVLSSNGGRDFGAFLGGLAQLGYGWAYRVVDAQYVRVESHPRAVPQRRRRVFVVGCSRGDWQRAASILLEPEGVRGDSAPRREARKEAPRGARPGAAGGGVAAVGNTLTQRMYKGPNTTLDEGQTLIPSAVAGGVAPAVAGTLGVRGTRSHTELDGQGAHVIEPLPFNTTQVTNALNRSNPMPGDPCHPLTRFGDPPAVAFSCKDYGGDATLELAPTLRAMPHDGSHANGGGQLAIAFKASHFTRGKDGAPSEIVPPLSADADKGDQDTLVASMMAVRRLTPRECERLQGFPDDWTAIVYRGKPASDGPRYKALGNSMAVNVMRWIGERIAMQLPCASCGTTQNDFYIRPSWAANPD